MWTPTQIAQNLKDNLDDPRMLSAALFIQDLLERKAPEVNIPQWRITNAATQTPIKSVAEFITSVDSTKLQVSYPYQGERFSGDRVTGYELIPTNIELRFHLYSEEDKQFALKYSFFSECDVVYQFCFYMAYMNDSDTALPLKISSLRIVGGV